MIVMRFGEVRRLIHTDTQRLHEISTDGTGNEGSADPIRLLRRLSLLARPEITVLWLHRIAHYFYVSRKFSLAQFFYRTNLIISGADIHPRCVIGESCLVVHPIGLILDADVGHKNTIFGHSIIQPAFDGKRWSARPVIGDGCTICIQVTVLGAIKVSNNITIAPFSYIHESLNEPNCTIKWLPGKQRIVMAQQGESC